MKRIVLLMVATVAICLGGHAQNNTRMEGKKTLVAYFSATGTTKRVAQLIASATQGELFAIEPEKAYTSADLDWNDKASRSSREMGDAKSRPAIQKIPDNLSAYDIVYIGYPIWWDEAPRVVNTFIERCNLTGKTVIPFATSGSSSISNSERVLRKTYPRLNWKPGRLLNRATEAEVAKFVR